ncbi:hypothetical protein BMS3Bbin04_01736 [bacterium BMS3Bbin04]|nr:hypothetical protein BMS3Bbin04_01736 [bacterium BMS3Bbin04]
MELDGTIFVQLILHGDGEATVRILIPVDATDDENILGTIVECLVVSISSAANRIQVVVEDGDLGTVGQIR